MKGDQVLHKSKSQSRVGRLLSVFPVTELATSLDPFVILYQRNQCHRRGAGESIFERSRHGLESAVQKSGRKRSRLQNVNAKNEGLTF
jgi:hypothetical protein